uniref:protein AATF n=1 Tax=Ciona intestinalis TaxID=7719 RepID=UPI00005217B6|nr:protein AATF [Ciona intestinalis]|eukprot:XP_002128895.1 protein AATF [Ciona intestinalis]
MSKQEVMNSIAHKFAELCEPKSSFDPEDDLCEETTAKLVDKVNFEEENENLSFSNKRFQVRNEHDNVGIYEGKKTTRSELNGNISNEDDEYEDIYEQEDSSADELQVDYDDNEEIDSDEAMGEDDTELFEMFKTKSSEHKQINKGQDTINQLNLWEILLESRIKMQKLVSLSNQLPRPNIHDVWLDKEGETLKSYISSSTKSLNKLGDKLSELQSALIAQDPEYGEGETRTKLAAGKTFDPDQWNSVIGQQYAVLKTSRNKRLQLWYDKTRVSSHKLDKSFNKFERSTVSQIDHVLSDRSRLIKRTRLKRSAYHVLGNIENENQSENNQLNSIDEEIFDDDDFYHQLLQKLIEQKSSSVVQDGIADSVEMTRQFLKLQRLRTKAKKTVDTKASKGRKVRYHIHPKLASFMAPIDDTTWTHESRNRIIKSLFGKLSFEAEE